MPDPGVRRRKAIVTGAAGFIGAAVSERLLRQGWSVVGLDAMNDYYDRSLKVARRDRLKAYPYFRFVQSYVETPGVLEDLFEKVSPGVVVHLAAQAGVRYSIEAPESYVTSNLEGTFRLLEAARKTPPDHIILASTSSVYGASSEMPYGELDRTDRPLSFYAATKKSCELLAHSYAHLYHLPITAPRFFTVYGPWGRPDMALFKFTRAALAGRPIDVYNHGQMQRDFTYIDDLVDGLVLLIGDPPVRAKNKDSIDPGDSLSPVAPFRVVNLGNSKPVGLLEFIDALESALGVKIARNNLPMQAGDVPATWADTSLAEQRVGFKPSVPLEEGVARFVKWYREFYQE